MNRLLSMALACLTGLAFIAPGTSGTAAAADLALIIGNHDYRQAPDARGTRIDAAAVEDALRRGGYEVISGVNMNRAEMRRAIGSFAGRVGTADRAVVYYSGHALQSGGVSYLAPVDQGNGSLADVMMDGVPFDLLLRLAGQAPGRAVVFVDAAQLDGFSKRSFAEPGLAQINVPDGVLVVSAAAPGRGVSRRPEAQSAFARQVVERFLKPGRRLSDAASGVGEPTWVSGRVNSSLVLVPAGRGQSSGDRNDTAAAYEEARLNLGARERWRLQDSLTRLGYDTRGTDGMFGPGTRAAIRNWQRANDIEQTGYLTAEQVAKIERQVSGRDTATDARSAAAIEARLGLDTSARREIQRNLTRLGYDTRGTDGGFGPGTRAAIGGWQRTNGLGQTGYLTAEQITKLDQQVRQAQATRDPATVEAQLGLSYSARRDIQQGLTRLGYDTRGTDGVFGSGTRTAIRNWQRANEISETGYLTGEQVTQLDQQVSQAEANRDPATVEARLGLNGTQRRDIQQGLTRLGYDTRGTDGNFGTGTRTAIRNWQRANDLGETGYLTGEQVTQLDQQVRQAEANGDPATVEARLGLSYSARRDIQQGLTRLGYDTRGTDGNFGTGTRTAIRNWQRANEISETGYLTGEQVTQLDRQVRQAEEDTNGRTPAEIEDRLGLSGTQRRDIQEGLTYLGYDTRGTGGTFGTGTRTAIRNWQRANDLGETGYLTGAQVTKLDQQVSQAQTESPAQIEQSLGLTRDDRLSIEQRLAHLGFVPGVQDGIFDQSTRQAIGSYQRNRDHPETGYLDRDTIAGIVEETRNSQSGLSEGARIIRDLLRGLGDGQQ